MRPSRSSDLVAGKTNGGNPRRSRHRGTTTCAAHAVGAGIGRCRAKATSGAGRRGARALACLTLLALAGPLTAMKALGAQIHPFVGSFNGSDSPAGSISADKVAIRQSTGDVYVIDKSHNLVDTFDSSGSYLSQVGPLGGLGGDPDIAVDNSATASEGNLYVLPEFGPLSAFDASGTPLYQLDGSTTPIGDFGDVCGTAVDSAGDVYVSDYSNHVIQKFDSSGNYLASIAVSFSPCDIAVDTDGTMYVIHWNNAVHKLDSGGTDQGIIDGNTPKAVNVDPSSHHVYVVHDSSVREFDASGTLLNEFGSDQLSGSRGVDIDGSTGNVYVSSGSKVVIFGPFATVPDVATGSATNVTAVSATLNGHVDPAGGGDIIDCHFEYGSDTSYGSSAPCVPAAPISSPTDVSADLSGLPSGVIHHFRVVAGNANGTVFGDDVTFAFSFLNLIDSFGTPGTGAGQFQAPIGVTVDRHGRVYVADRDNARLQKFDKRGRFKGAWGWGVKDGAETSEVCKKRTDCQAGVAGSGAGQFALPTSVAVDAYGRKSEVYIGDAGNNVVQKFNRFGKYLTTIDGSAAPQGHFVGLVGVAVDQSSQLWTADAGTGNVDEFDSAGNFLQEWSPGISIQAIAVDAVHDAVYLIDGSGETVRFTLGGGNQTTIDAGSGVALAVDPETGDLYVAHGGDVAVYDATGTRIDSLFSLGATTDPGGLAYYSTGHRRSAGRRDRLYVTDTDNDLVAIYGPPPAGAPFITAESSTHAGATSQTLNASIVPLGSATTCTFEYVTDAEFQMNGYTNATSVPCTPADLGSSYTHQQTSATADGLTIGATYHYHVVATNSFGTSTGADQTFQAGPGGWIPFSRCNVDDPAMLAADGVNLVPLCLASNSTHGSITLGMLPQQATGNSNLQGGLVGDLNNAVFTFIAPLGGALIADPVDVDVNGTTVTATVESAGTPTDFDLFAGLSLGAPIITLPIKIHLTGPGLGPVCYIGSDMDPIVLHPANTDLSNATADIVQFDADGTLNPNGAIGALTVSGTIQGDSAFSVPAATGCGPNGDGSFDQLVNDTVGLPSPSGMNDIVLEDASSSLALPVDILTGAEFAAAWHSAFGN
jgi:hypothetical protein